MAVVALNVTDDLCRSIAKRETYPTNLIDRNTYLTTLKAYQVRLDQAAGDLLVADESAVDVRFRDWELHQTAQVFNFERRGINGLLALKQHLGIRDVTPPPRDPQAVSVEVTKRDPQCRFIFLYGDHSRAPLKITKDMLVELLSYHQVMSGYLDFLFLFGRGSGPKDLRFSGFRELTSLSARPSPMRLDSMGRSSRYYELCYNLKSVDAVPDAEGEYPWSIRQAGIYHKFDIWHGTTTWIISKGSLDLKDRIQELTGNKARSEDRDFSTPITCFRSSLAVHLMLVHWSCESWRWYIQWLETKIDNQTKQAVYGTRESKSSRKTYTAKDLQDIQHQEDRVYEASMVMDANIDIISALRGYYESLLEHKDFTLATGCEEYILECAKQMKNATYDLKMQTSRANVLGRLVNGRKNLILQHLQAQTAENMEDLTTQTFSVGVSAQKEAIVMRIITVVTLVFLPATFVSTFFSTDVVHYSNASASSNSTTTNGTSAESMSMDNTSFSSLAMWRWLQVSLPLTAVTATIAVIWYIRERRRLKSRLAAFGYELV